MWGKGVEQEMIDLFDVIFLVSAPPDAAFSLFTEFARKIEPGMVARVLGLVGRIVKSTLGDRLLAREEVMGLMCEWFDGQGAQDFAVQNAVAAIITFAEPDVGPLAEVVDRLIEVVLTGEATSICIASVAEVVKFDTRERWRVVYDPLFVAILRYREATSTADVRRIVKALVTLLRFATPGVVSANVDAVMDWFGAVVPSKNAAVAASVLTGVLEMQAIEDRIGSGRQVVVEFCDENADFLDELGCDPPEAIGLILEALWMVWEERTICLGARVSRTRLM
jgi:hypothetical protein